MKILELTVFYFLCFIIEAVILQQYATSLFVSKHSLKETLCTLGLLYLVLFAVSLLNMKWLNIGLYLLFNFIFLITQYRLKFHMAFFHSALITAVMSMCELLIYNLVERFTPHFFSEVEQVNNMIVFIIFSKLLFFTIIYIISHILKPQKKSEQRFNNSILFLLFIPITTIFIMLIFVSISDHYALTPVLNWMISLGAGLLLISNLFVFGMNQYAQKKNQEYTEIQLQLQRESNFTEYYKMLLTQNENQSILIHDIKKHLQSLELLNEQNERDKIQAYIQQLLLSSDLKEVSRICEHEMLNAILSRYKRQCDDKNISFIADIRSGTNSFLTENELTALYCNLLENAIEATNNVQNPYIEINVTKRENTPFIVITVINSCLVNPFSVENEGKLISHKPDKEKHGFGMKSINKIVKKYHGNMQMYYNDDSLTFHTIITLKETTLYS